MILQRSICLRVSGVVALSAPMFGEIGLSRCSICVAPRLNHEVWSAVIWRFHDLKAPDPLNRTTARYGVVYGVNLTRSGYS